jgi:hypothetical protein
MIHPKRFLTLSAVMAFSFLVLEAQTNFQPAYYITHNQDTIYGEIDNRGDLKNGSICEFRTDPNAENTQFEPGDIYAYRFIDGKYYISTELNVDGELKVVFAEYLVNGVLDLLYHRSINNDHYYMEAKNGDWLELTNKDIQLMRDGVSYTRKSNQYKGMLRANFSEYPEMQKEIDKASFKHQSLIKLTKQYHDYSCTTGEECIIYEKQPPVVGLHVAPMAGFGLNWLSVPSHPQYGSFSFTQSNDLLLGMRIKVTLPRLNDKLSFLLIPEYGRSYFYSQFEEQLASQVDQFTEIHSHRSYISTALGMQYTFPRGKLRPTISLGPLMAYHTEFDFRIRKEVAGSTTVETREIITEIPGDAAFGGFLQGGIEIRGKSRPLFDISLSYHFTLANLNVYMERETGGLGVSGTYGMHLQGLTLRAGYYLF